MNLAQSFEDDLEAAVLDDVDATMRDPDGPAAGAVAQAEARLEEFADQYDVGSLIDALEGPIVERTDSSVTVRWRCDHPAAGYFEFGTPDHYSIEGDPVLSFVWKDPPQWVKEEFDQEGDGWRVFFGEVDSGQGIVETRFMRWSLRWFREEVAR